jgi:co-chaperonin GroES (HSP10)
MTLGGGDLLARGAKSAQFSAGVNDKDAPVILHNVAPEEPEQEKFGVGFTVTDRRSSFDSQIPVANPVQQSEQKFTEKEYSSFRPIMDRILVKRVSTDKNMELQTDGSLRDKKTGFIIPAKFRQHSNVGVVLAAGDFVVMGGVKTDLSEIVRPGDRITYGDYNSEVFHMAEDKVIALCDAVGLNYEKDEEGLRIVRVQDIRGVERPL